MDQLLSDQDGNLMFNIAKVARESGIPASTIWYRIDVLGWDVERAISVPARKREMSGKYSKDCIYTYQGKQMTLERISILIDVELKTLFNRIRTGKTEETGLFARKGYRSPRQKGSSR
jgi:hypothetical protein